MTRREKYEYRLSYEVKRACDRWLARKAGLTIEKFKEQELASIKYGRRGRKNGSMNQKFFGSTNQNEPS